MSRTGAGLEAWTSGSITQGAERHPCAVLLRYEADDPFVVTLTVSPGTAASPRTSSRWVISRDLLTAGLGGAVGIGAVSVLPGQNPDEPAHVTIRVQEQGAGRGTETLIRLGHAALMTYLERSHALQPFGTEPTEMALDRELARILGDGDGHA
ncbi:SsgA family sporulation/cell division regulator [Streptomyces xanthii]|uniref:SsgA family sporulation/cell division regulator n=1 Tax=Streptomyces xanthii TaxID=2768069 RepID=A0A7H1B7G6_9ACTN|nr:SsgA family sporulation/cell division regulator [Streptomyces xanthii]QNS04671.1 SsgA family sporulation/cell division regulator [Streptomyces xanthii]